MKLFFSLLFATVFISSQATTWDEPWQDKIVKTSQSFVLAKVISCDQAKGVRIKIIKLLAGLTVPDSVIINQFSLLHLCSYAADEPPSYRFSNIDSCYFFLTQNDSAGYSMATPTSGFAVLYNGMVSATYRHSYHQASVEAGLYEKTMSAIFQHYHNLAFDTAYINRFVDEQLKLKPAGFGKDEIQTFFKQHVALELIFHLQLPQKYELILPFLNVENFHSQASAARALTWYNTAGAHSQLIAVIANDKTKDFVKVMAVWALRQQHPADIKQQLTGLSKTANDNSDGFGGNIMDPRVCTDVPSVKKALNELINSL